jgi:hypothetical protein
MARLPEPGSDDGTWGDILNNYLSVEHNADGSLKARSDGTISSKANDSEVLKKASNLSDLATPTAARANLGLGNSATKDTGVTGGTVAAGNDSRITGALQTSQLGQAGGVAAYDATQTSLGQKLDSDGPELFLMTFFKDPSGGGGGTAADDDMRMYVGASGDGVEFSQLSNAVSPWGYRDISMIEVNGYYYVTGTSIGADPAQQYINVHRSPSLLPGTWTDVATIDIKTARPSGVRSWAAEFFKDDDGSIYIVASIGDGATDLDFNNPFRPYLFKANDQTLTAWTAQGKMTRSGTRAGFASWDNESAIDGDVVKIGSTYHMFIKEGRTQYIIHHTATSLLGPWAYSESSSTYGWNSNNEAPNLVRLANGHWRMYMDYLSVGQIYYADTTSVDDLTSWGSRTKCRVPLDGRHPFVMRTTARRHRDLVVDLALTGGALTTPLMPFYARAYKSNSTHYNGPNWYQVNFDKKFDPEGAVDLTNDQIAVPKTGVYRIESQVMFSPGPGVTGFWILRIIHYSAGGTVTTYNADQTGNNYVSYYGNGDQLCLNINKSIYCWEGDYFEMWVYPGVGAGVGFDIRGDSFGDGKNYFHVIGT